MKNSIAQPGQFVIMATVPAEKEAALLKDARASADWGVLDAARREVSQGNKGESLHALALSGFFGLEAQREAQQAAR